MSASSADAFPMDGFPFPFVREFIDANGGEAAFEGLTTDEVKDRFIVPQTQATKLSLCAQMKQAGDARIQPATWFVSHAWKYKFLDLVKALEAFFADKGGMASSSFGWIYSTRANIPLFPSRLNGGSKLSSPPLVKWGRW